VSSLKTDLVLRQYMINNKTGDTTVVYAVETYPNCGIKSLFRSTFIAPVLIVQTENKSVFMI